MANAPESETVTESDLAVLPEPPQGKRLHKATYATDKRRPGKYLIRIIGPTADKFKAGREVPVTRKDNTESMETLDRCIWAGRDEETGEPVALYHFVEKERVPEQLQPDLPF